MKLKNILMRGVVCCVLSGGFSLAFGEARNVEDDPIYNLLYLGRVDKVTVSIENVYLDDSAAEQLNAEINAGRFSKKWSNLVVNFIWNRDCVLELSLRIMLPMHESLFSSDASVKGKHSRVRLALLRHESIQSNGALHLAEMIKADVCRVSQEDYINYMIELEELYVLSNYSFSLGYIFLDKK
jgi:hypothetical protein